MFEECVGVLKKRQSLLMRQDGLITCVFLRFSRQLVTRNDDEVDICEYRSWCAVNSIAHCAIGGRNHDCKLDLVRAITTTGMSLVLCRGVEGACTTQSGGV